MHTSKVALSTLTTTYFQNFSLSQNETLNLLNSNSFPHLPSPWQSVLLSVSMNLPILISHVSGIIQYWSFYVWLISLSFQGSSMLYVYEFHSF